MTIFGRRNRYAPSSSQLAAQKLRKAREQRRSLLAEPLEPRAMMDGNGLVRFPFWNIAQPRDVNTDGRVTAMDALAIVNDLNLRGARSLSTGGAAGAAGEDGNSPTQYIDVNNDNRVSAMDALMVINALNSGGEGDPMIRYTVEVVQMGTNDPLTQINKGGFYEMRVLVTDLGILTYMGNVRPATLPLDHPTNPGETALGVYTSFFDVQWNNTTATDVQTNESQLITFTGTPVTGQTFTLTVNDGGTLKTTAPITVGANTASGRNTTNNNIEAALNTLLGAGTVDVINPVTSQNQWRVRFLNRLSNRDVPEMTATPSGSFGATIAITELNNGLPTTTAAYTDALLPREVLDATNFPINAPLFYTAQRQGNRATFGINDVGGTMASTSAPFPGTDPMEILRVRMNAVDAGNITFNVSIDDIISGLETGLVGFNIPVTADLVEVVTDTITITEPLSAGNDIANTTEGSVTPITIDVLANDFNNPNPGPQLTKTIDPVLDLTGTLGSAVVSGNQIIYTPPGGDVFGTDSFKYTVRDTAGNVDIGTVTIHIAPVNDAPVVNGPIPQGFNEDTPRVFSTPNGNAITVTDVDAVSGQLTMTLTVGAGNGTISVANLPGAPGGVTNNNSSTVTVNGTLTDLNAALQNLTYTPVQNASGTVNLTVTVNDNGHTPNPAQIGSRVIVLNIAAVNDAPVVELGGFTVTPTVQEGDPLVLNAANNTLIQVSDVDAGTNPVVVTLNVAAGNTITVPVTAGVTIGTNGTNNVTLTGTVADINTALTSITYQAAIGFAPTSENLQITINDQGNTGGAALTDTETRTINIDPAVRPAARNDVLVVDEDSVGNGATDVNEINVLANDLVNLPGAPTVLARLISFQTTTLQGGTVVLDPGPTGADTDDTLVYTPPADYSGPDSFTYVMNDTSAMGANSTGTVNITVREMNDAPTAVDDPLASVPEDSTAITFPASALTANDSPGPASESGQTLTITAVGNAVGGTVALVSGNPVFTPTANYNGPASFDYTITDNGLTNGNPDPLTDTATVTFTITEVNDAPVGVPSPVSLSAIDEDSGNRTISIASLVAGDTPGGGADEVGQTVTLTSVAAIAGGTVQIVGSDVIFTPQTDFNGTASFSYLITDNGTTAGVADPQSTSVTVSFTVNPLNDAPVAGNDTAQTGEGQLVTIPVTVNDSDVDASPTFVAIPGTLSAGTTISIISGPANGTANVVGNTIQYTPSGTYNGPDTITYQLNDNSGAANQLSNVATINITVLPKNDPPVANPDPNIVATEDVTLAIDVFANDSDPDTANTEWSFILVTPPQHGTAVFNTTTRRVDYTPAANYNGPDSFVYKINDNSPIAPINLESGNATVSITVREVNDAPIANNDPVGPAFIVIKDRDRTFTAASLTANDSPGLPANESGQSITITSVSYTNPAGFSGGSVTLVGGVVTYTAPAGYIGPDSFTYTITDNGTTAGVADPKTATATVNLSVVDFIPVDIQGHAYIDADNDGVFDPNERPLGGVDVTLAGTSLITGAITPITMTTNLDGFYIFSGIEPGTYTLTEQSPFALRDGKDTAGAGAALSATNDVINLTFPLLDGPTLSVNNFAELGVDAGQLTDSQGLIGELLASSTATGFVLAATMTGDMFWSWALNGWNGCDGIAIDLDADLSAATLTATHNGTTYTTRIFQDPFDTRNANRTNPNPVARLARFRLLGHDANGNHIIRLDGTAEHFYGVGSPLAFAPATGSGGEDVSAGEYVESVDAAMAEGSWA